MQITQLSHVQLKQDHGQYYFVLQILHKVPPSTTLYCKARTRHFPVLLCTTQLAQGTSQYYFVLQSLHRIIPSTNLYYKVCTRHFPVQLCTTKLAQGTSQYYFVLHSLHKALPSTTLYYKACTQHFSLLCTTQLAQGTSQHSTTLYYKACTKHFPSTTLYHKACTRHFSLLCTTQLAQGTSQHSTTLYYKACTKYFPVLLCTTKLAQGTSQYYFVLQSLHKALPSTTWKGSIGKPVTTSVAGLVASIFLVWPLFCAYHSQDRILRTELTWGKAGREVGGDIAPTAESCSNVRLPENPSCNVQSAGTPRPLIVWSRRPSADLKKSGPEETSLRLDDSTVFLFAHMSANRV